MAANGHNTFQQARPNKLQRFPRAANRTRNASSPAFHPAIPLQCQLNPQNVLAAQSLIGNRAVVQLLSQAHSRENQSVNKTGLPTPLKTGMESLSGIDLSDVRVHYHSEKPAQLQALAYTQGEHIYLRAGQERHLPHEAWHVVQQKQGRVKPTLQMKNGISVNDNPALEKEATQWGEKAYQQTPDLPSLRPLRQGVKDAQVVQRRVTEFKPEGDNPMTISSALTTSGLDKIYAPTVDNIPKGNMERAKKVTAKIALPFVTGVREGTNAEYEQVLKLGEWEHLASTHTKERNLDTGHLIADAFFLDIGDEFVKADSYKAKNLAPQDSSENRGTYLSKEKEIRTTLLKDEKDKNKKFTEEIKKITPKEIAEKVKTLADTEPTGDVSDKINIINIEELKKVAEQQLVNNISEDYINTNKEKFFKVVVEVDYLSEQKFSLETLLERHALKIINKAKHDEFKNSEINKSHEAEKNDINNNDQIQIDNHFNTPDVENLNNGSQIEYDTLISVPSRIPTKWKMTITEKEENNVFYNYEKEKPLPFYNPNANFSLEDIFKYEQGKLEIIDKKEKELTILKGKRGKQKDRDTLNEELKILNREQYNRYTSKQKMQAEQSFDYAKKYVEVLKTIEKPEGLNEQKYLELFQQFLIYILKNNKETFQNKLNELTKVEEICELFTKMDLANPRKRKRTE
ncbi:DUF4157 domain-containing protein [Candidatus Regiella insecticola]|uniref:eCIS core domain-containing protein n=1 Tax=Candidatus Regiella insecticola TaxID=138073 RepID=UPI0015968559|nr:DUF4157 domain-containing protein [Candidatus Regiella insecticola]